MSVKNQGLLSAKIIFRLKLYWVLIIQNHARSTGRLILSQSVINTGFLQDRPVLHAWLASKLISSKTERALGAII